MIDQVAREISHASRSRNQRYISRVCPNRQRLEPVVCPHPIVRRRKFNSERTTEKESFPITRNYKKILYDNDIPPLPEI